MAALTTFPTRWLASFVVKERWPCGLAGLGLCWYKYQPWVEISQQPVVDIFEVVAIWD